MINVAVLGYGTVGSGVVEVIEKNKDMVNKKSAQELEVKYILDLRDFPGDPYENKVIHDFNTILQDDSVTIICETMGGVGAAYQFTKQALELGKSVCTSNKELVAKHGPELLQIAREHNCNYLFEASVGWRYFPSCLGILSGNLSGRKFPGWLRESVLLSLQWDLQHFSS